MGFSSIQYYNSKRIKLNVNSKNNEPQGKIIILSVIIFSEKGTIFELEFSQRDNWLRCKLVIRKMRSIYGLKMEWAYGRCDISISNQQVAPHGIFFFGGINEILHNQNVWPLSCITGKITDIVVDIKVKAYDDKWNNRYFIVSDCNLTKRTWIHKLKHKFKGSKFVISSNENIYECFVDGCSLSYRILCWMDKVTLKCQLCQKYVTFLDKFYYKCLDHHICCINCFGEITKLLQVGCSVKDSLPILFR